MQFLDTEAGVEKKKKKRRVGDPRSQPRPSQKCEMCGGYLMAGQEVCSPDENPHATYHVDCWKLVDGDYEPGEDADEEEEEDEDDEEPLSTCLECGGVREVCGCDEETSDNDEETHEL